MMATTSSTRMEKIPVACAMEWSIELEKGLRSQTPGKSVEEILKVGQRLKLLNGNSKVGMVEHQIFDLIPGEDKLYVNAICHRLADAFRTGSKEIKSCIVKVFLELFKSRRKRDSCSKSVIGGILDKLDNNKLELLKRVKLVFDNGDVEERAMALVLFGCFANLAKDSADIRYCVFSGLRSDHVNEVDASLFAARCFAELTDDFGFVLLQMFVNMLTSSSQLPFDTKLAFGRAFSNFSSSFQVANEAYMAGLGLILDSSEEKFSNVMMVSLTKISSKWTLLIPKQVDFLLKFIAGNIVLGIQATALKCLHFILSRRLCSFSWTTERIHKFVHIINEFPALNYDALKVLHKILMYNIPCFSTLEMGEIFSLFLSFAEKTIQSSNVSYRLQAFRHLVDVSGHMFKKSKDSTIACKIVSVIMDRIFLLAKTNQIDEKVEQEIISLLKLLLNLVQRHVEFSGLVMDRLCSFMLYLENILCHSSASEGVVNDESLNFDIGNLINILFKSSLCLTRVMFAAEKTKLFYDSTSQILNTTKILVENMLKPFGFHSYTSKSYLLLLQFYSSYHYISQVMKQGYFGTNASPFCEKSVPDHEVLGLECAKKIVEERDYWCCYKAGKYAACQGSWSIASFIFEKLTDKFQYASSSWWLKSLTLLSCCENQIQLLGSLLSKDGLCEEEAVRKIDSCDYADILVKLQNNLQLFKEMLGSSFSRVDFTWQKWFLEIRVKSLEAVLDITRLLSLDLSQRDDNNNLVHSFRQIAYKLKRIAYEFDFLVISFIGMDKESTMIMSNLALSCSFLAFTITFAFSIQSQASQEMDCGGLDNFLPELYVELIQDLLGRLWCLDSKSRESLLVLLKVYQSPTSCSLVDSRNQCAATSGESKIIAELCQHSILKIISLQNEARKLCNTRSITQTSYDGMELLLNIISRWMQIPFRCPNNFFQVKPFLSSELFAMNENGENIHKKSFSTNSHLQLNLCLQLKHMPPSFTVHLSRLYCILCCEMKTSNLGIGDQFCLNEEPQQIDHIFMLNEKLLQYLKGSARRHGIVRTDNDYNWAQDKYVCFNAINNGQGFSCCLLDISSFPAGLYQIKWHSCGIDIDGSYWSILPQNCGPIFNVIKS